MAKEKTIITESVPPQELTKYNRESGKKTLMLVSVLITLIVVLTIALLLLFRFS